MEGNYGEAVIVHLYGGSQRDGVAVCKQSCEGHVTLWWENTTDVTLLYGGEQLEAITVAARHDRKTRLHISASASLAASPITSILISYIHRDKEYYNTCDIHTSLITGRSSGLESTYT